MITATYNTDLVPYTYYLHALINYMRRQKWRILHTCTNTHYIRAICVAHDSSVDSQKSDSDPLAVCLPDISHFPTRLRVKLSSPPYDCRCVMLVDLSA